MKSGRWQHWQTHGQNGFLGRNPSHNYHVRHDQAHLSISQRLEIGHIISKLNRRSRGFGLRGLDRIWANLSLECKIIGSMKFNKISPVSVCSEVLCVFGAFVILPGSSLRGIIYGAGHHLGEMPSTILSTFLQFYTLSFSYFLVQI